MGLTKTDSQLSIKQSNLLKLRWLLAAILSACLAVWAAIWLMADILHSRGIATLYSSLDSPTSQAQWDRGWTLLGYARKLNPLHAEYPFYQAYFSHNRALGSRESAENPPDDRTRSLDYFYPALRQRPHWGYVWAQLAEMRLVNGEGDEETFGALEKALIFAPYEPFVLHISLKVGFTFWDRLDNGLRQKLIFAVRYLLQHDPKSVIDTALVFEWSEQLRPLLIDARDLEYLDNRLAHINKNPVAE